MAGTKEGGQLTVSKVKARNPDHYRIIGSMGGKKGSGPDYQVGGIKAAGFAAMTPAERAAAGKKGGTISRRKKTSKRNSVMV